LPRRPTTSTVAVNEALAGTLKTKEFQKRMPFGDFLKALENSISKKGKEVQFDINEDAFPFDNQRKLEIHEEEVVLPEVPERMPANVALRLAISQVGGGNATYWIRAGQIVITSRERVLSRHYLDSTQIECNFNACPLGDALDELAEQAGVSIIVDSRVANKAQTKVTAKFQGAKLRTAVELLTDTAALKAVVVDNVIYVTKPNNVGAFKEKTNFQLSDGDSTSGGGFQAFTNRSLFSAVDLACGQYVLDGRVKNQMNLRVTAKWINHVQPDTKLRLLTDMAGLRHVVMDDVAYITSPANAKKLEEERARKKP
jgi:hypothetical protein